MTNPAPSFAEANRTWARIALLSFGGLAAQIALMHRLLVDEQGSIEIGLAPTNLAAAAAGLAISAMGLVG